MTQYLSKKFKIISFFSIILVLYLHSYNCVINFSDVRISLDKGYSTFIQDFFSNGITRVAVPFFFSISGFLFFFKMNGSLHEFTLKFERRIKTLVLPYLIWSIWGLSLFFILQNLPISDSFFSNRLIRDYSVNEILIAIFIHPIPYQLWFVRDLIILVFLSPVIYLLITHIKYLIIFIFLITWFINFNFFVLSNEALFFFMLGALLGINNLGEKIQIGTSKKRWIYTYFWVTIVLVKTILIYIGYENEMLINFLQKIGILIGILALWCLYDIIYKNKDVTTYNTPTIFSFSFFIFVFHEPVLIIIKKVLFRILGNSEFLSLFVYLISPILTLSLSLFVGIHLKQLRPKFFEIITGGR